MEKKEPIKISLPIFMTIIVLLVAIVYGAFMYMQNEKLENEIADLRDGMSQSQTEKNDNSFEKYKGIWQYYESNNNIPEMELNIKNIEDNVLSFDLNVYRIAGYENVNAKLSGNVATFEFKDDDEIIKGTITLDDNKVILKIIDSIKIEHKTIIFSEKSNSSVLSEKTNSDIGEYFVLYNGVPIPIKIGKVTSSYINQITETNKEKYNITYFNYRNGKYMGETEGYLVEGPFDNTACVDYVEKIAMSKKFNATPRTYRKINELPKELIDMADYTTVDIHSIDLDGDGKEEKIVCDTVNYGKGEVGNGEPVASSRIMLFDSNYKKIADLVNLEDGFAEQGQQKHEASKVFLSLDMVEYIDIDNDGIMEIIIDIPMYEGDGLSDLSILKYNKGNLEGETNIKANVRP